MLSEQLADMGVVGAGGGGFPAHVKAAARVEYVLANGAECEPLLHKDAELMAHHATAIVAGMARVVEATGATKAVFGLKEKNRHAVDAVRRETDAGGIDLLLLGDYYPAGDEYELVQAATGRLIPAGGIPLHVGCLVNNVETFLNIEHAAAGVPVTRKFLTVTGAVRRAMTVNVPIGISFRELIAHCGGATSDELGLLVGGAMMGHLSFDLDEVVTKTTGGLIVLPAGHDLVQRKARPVADMHRIGKSACDQCSYCTEFCPRYLLGYDVQPHKVMRSLGFTTTGAANWNQWGDLCCGCGICTLYACPEGLYPKEACDSAKTSLRREGITFTQQKPVTLHPMKDYRRIPVSMLRKRLGLDEWEREAPLDDTVPEPSRVRLKLKQHAGAPAAPVVAVGDTVRAGQAVARVGAGQLGATVHTSIGGRVAAITADAIEVTR